MGLRKLALALTTQLGSQGLVGDGARIETSQARCSPESNTQTFAEGDYHLALFPCHCLVEGGSLLASVGLGAWCLT